MHRDPANLPAAGVRSAPAEGVPLKPSTSSPMFSPDDERFGSRDVAAAEAQRRQANLARRDERIEDKRSMNSYREAQRLGQMESTLRQEQEKYQQRRDTGTGNRRNQSQVQYDLMTLDYKSTPGGQALKQQDALIAEQQQQRFDMLYTKVNRTTHNIITGQLLPPRHQ